MKNFLLLLILLLALVSTACSHKEIATESGEVGDLHRYLKYSETFASSSQPSEEELKVIVGSGVERVIYIALNDSHGALKNEDQIVRSLGMEYVHIPVDFKNPTLRDFQDFVSEMQNKPDMNTLLHCQVNLRASTFSFLYRAIFQGVPIAEAKADMDSIWEPNENWFKFIQTVASHYKLDLLCDDCDWGKYEFAEPN